MYFALLREQRGLSSEAVQTEATDASSLYGELVATHGFTLEKAQLQVALNGDFAGWDVTLSDGDELAFLPPVAGG